MTAAVQDEGLGLLTWSPDVIAPEMDGTAWDMPEADYHADPWRTRLGIRSLSASTAKMLLPPSTPEHALHTIENPRHSDSFDLGTTVHTLVLGRGGRIVQVDAPDWRTKAAREQREEAHAAGLTPILVEDYARAQAAADIVLAHETAGPLLRLPGRSEVVLTWVIAADDPYGAPVACRAMLDRWPDPTSDVPPLIVDVKTTESADDESISKTVEKYRYQLQETWYRLGYAAVHGVEPGFAFVFVEKQPPHAVRVAELDDANREEGADQVAAALDKWRDLPAAGPWPGRPTDIGLIGRPAWARRTPREDY
jgi:hypothetical protein